MKISVIIPTKNEPLIGQLVNEIHESLSDQDHEIIVVDKSEKKSEISNAKLISQKSDGLGNAIMEGLNYVKGDAIVIMDGDLSHNPTDINRLVQELNTFDIVIGSRYIKGGITDDKIHRKFFSHVFRSIANPILGLNVKDSMSGFSAIKKEVFDNLTINPLGYKINMEVMFKGIKEGYKVGEVPINFQIRKSGKSKANFKEAFRILRYIFELKTGLR